MLTHRIYASFGPSDSSKAAQWQIRIGARSGAQQTTQDGNQEEEKKDGIQDGTLEKEEEEEKDGIQDGTQDGTQEKEEEEKDGIPDGTQEQEKDGARALGSATAGRIGAQNKNRLGRRIQKLEPGVVLPTRTRRGKTR